MTLRHILRTFFLLTDQGSWPEPSEHAPILRILFQCDPLLQIVIDVVQ